MIIANTVFITVIKIEAAYANSLTLMGTYFSPLLIASAYWDAASY